MEIRKNDYDLSISKYREIEYEEIEYDPPRIIIDKIAEKEDKIKKNLEELRNLV